MGQVFSSFIENCNCGDSANKIDEELSHIKMDIHNIKSNHLYHIERDIAEMKMDIKIIVSKLS